MSMFGLRLIFIEHGGRYSCSVLLSIIHLFVDVVYLCGVFRPTELGTSPHNIRCMCMTYQSGAQRGKVAQALFSC